MTREKLIREAFLLGFMVSREGFNGEFAVDGSWTPKLKPHYMTMKTFRARMKASPHFNLLQGEAVKRLEANRTASQAAPEKTYDLHTWRKT